MKYAYSLGKICAPILIQMQKGGYKKDPLKAGLFAQSLNIQLQVTFDGCLYFLLLDADKAWDTEGLLCCRSC